MINKTFPSLALAAALAAGGCAQPYQAGVYHSGMQAQPVEIGKVLAVQPVQVASGKENAGALVGLLGGAAAGSALGGHGTTSLLAIIGGALGGSWLGSKAEQAASRQPAYQITVRLLRGPTISVVEQGRRAASLSPGACVQVIQGRRGRARVMPLPSSSCPAPVLRAAPGQGVSHYLQ